MADTKTAKPVDVNELLTKTREEFEAERERLRPFKEAHDRISAIIASWDTTTRKSAGARVPRGKRSEEFMALVRETPGISVSDAAERMPGVHQNYLYKLAAASVKAGQLRKEGTGYFPVDAPAEIASLDAE